MNYFNYGEKEIQYLKDKDKILGAAIEKIGMMRLHDLDKVTKSEFEKYRKIYSPYGSVASLYLWQLSI